MNVNFSEEQRMLQDSVRELFKRELSTKLVRELQEPGASGHSEKLWQQLANDGWLGIAIPEEYGGSGASLLELGIVYEEAGRALAPTTLFCTIFAAQVILSLGSEEQRKQYLGHISAGQALGTIAYSEKEVVNNPTYFSTCARRQGDEWVLSGTKYFVPNAHLTDFLLVAACTNDAGKQGLTVFIVPRNAQGVEMEFHANIGRDRQNKVRLNEVRLGAAAVLGGEEAAGRAQAGLASAVLRATALHCFEMVGGMQHMLDTTIQYTSERRQFGVPIGSFQAVHHHVADMAMSVDGARLVSCQALCLLADGNPAEREVAIAKAWSGEAYKSVSLMSHQLWGGMGFALESDLFLWSNRAKTTELSFGTRDYHLGRLAEMLLGPA